MIRFAILAGALMLSTGASAQSVYSSPTQLCEDTVTEFLGNGYLDRKPPADFYTRGGVERYIAADKAHYEKMRLTWQTRAASAGLSLTVTEEVCQSASRAYLQGYREALSHTVVLPPKRVSSR